MESSQNEPLPWENQQHEMPATAGSSQRQRQQQQQQQQQQPSPQDEIISVYEVFVKDDSADAASTAKLPEVSVISALPVVSQQQQQQQQQLIQALDLDAIDIISADGDGEDEDETTAEASEQETPEAPQSAATVSEKNTPAYTAADRLSSANAQLIDKDDPRSRLHYVKYLKRDGKTLKIWECGICSKEFRHQYTLMRHLPTHTDERNFKCDACGKAFRQLSTLSQHKAIHSDARPYVCEFCKKTFNRVSTLISHRKTHSEHKPHKCHHCGKGFHQKGNLRNHEFTHTNERPYKCDLCDKGFNQMSNLVCHKVKAHAHAEKMQYTCGICGKEFPRRSNLRSHEEFKHGIKYRQTASTPETPTNESRNLRRSVRVLNEPEDDQQGSFSDSRDRDMHMTEFMENIIIDKIETKAMESALQQGQTPFALFKPAKGIPVLVKVTPSGSVNHLLTPATADDLKMSGKMDSSSTQLSDLDGSKSVQIKVPVVATVTERNEDGRISFVIEPPGPDQEQVYMVKNSRNDRRSNIFIHIFPFPLPTDSLLTPVDSVSEILPDDCDYSPLEELPSQQTPSNTPIASHDATDEELLELAAMGGIQFVRATEDGRYEVMTNSEARDLMAQNSHDVKIIGTTDEAIGNAHAEFDYLPVTALDEIRSPSIQQQQPSEIIVPDSNGIMVLDPNNDQKALTLNDIEMLEGKELGQLLEIKCLEDQYEDSVPGGTYLSQAKIDQILNAKTTNVDAIAGIMGENIDPGTIQSELPSILNHQTSEFSTIAASTLYGRNLQVHHQPQQHHQQYPQYPLSIEPEPMPLFKNTQNYNDDFSAIFGDELPTAIDYSVVPEYTTRPRLPEFDDDPESIFMTIGQSGGKVIAQKNRSAQMFDSAIERDYDDRIVERSIEPPVRHVEDRNPVTDIPSQYEDFRFQNSYDQFFKSTMYDSHLPNFNSIATPLSTLMPDLDAMKRDMQILERTLESKFFAPDDFNNKENEKPFKVLDQIPAEGSFGHNGSAVAGVLSSVENFFGKEQDKVKMDTGNFLQPCSPCGPGDFLYFENRLSERELASSPSRTLEKSLHDREFVSDGLPDLDC
ncbi:serendipity locus protein H-1-like isoform X2 [Nasonia vitripennis]|uniref:C2H2-type domain-containing protein n=1 Tax=Nasonia vitripennis TaxID=7425 RepID=A0A7M7Q6V2_NASVI|nr:serendipity locus protein H-1-like isoform X2 [Nasonia vitripennis]